MLSQYHEARRWFVPVARANCFTHKSYILIGVTDVRYDKFQEWFISDYVLSSTFRTLDSV